MRQHLPPHVRQDHALGAEVGQMRADVRIVQVPLDGLGVVVRLGNHEVCAVPDHGEIVGPLAVTGIRDDLPGDFDPQRRRIRLRRVPRRVRCDDEIADRM